MSRNLNVFRSPPVNSFERLTSGKLSMNEGVTTIPGQVQETFSHSMGFFTYWNEFKRDRYFDFVKISIGTLIGITETRDVFDDPCMERILGN